MNKQKDSRTITELFPKGCKWLKKHLAIFVFNITEAIHKLKIINTKLNKSLKKANKAFKIYLLICLLVSSIVLTFIVYPLSHYYKEIKNERDGVLNRAFYWENVLTKHTFYPDAYYEAAWNYYVLGNKDKSRELLQKALVIDPSFKEAEELLKKVNFQ